MPLRVRSPPPQIQAVERVACRLATVPQISASYMGAFATARTQTARLDRNTMLPRLERAARSVLIQLAITMARKHPARSRSLILSELHRIILCRPMRLARLTH